MNADYAGSPRNLRVLLLAPFALLIVAAFVLMVAAFSASGAAAEVRYPDNLPVYAGLLAAVPALVFGVVASFLIWTRTFGSFEVKPLRLLIGLVAILAAAAMVFAYTFIVGDPEHYKGEFDVLTQQWEPRVPTAGSYLSLVLGVATFFPMGALAVTAKYLYIDAIQPAKLDRPEGYDPIGIMLRTQGPGA
jgi:hypothetical protein